jgi:hypothetical protein
MRFQVECFENVDAFGSRDSIYAVGWTQEDFPFHTAPLRRVVNLNVEANTSEGAAEAAFEIGNAPWNPTDTEGVAWPHNEVRSMSSTDVVVVHTPDGPVAYGCLSVGWKRLPQLPLNIVAALA